MTKTIFSKKSGQEAWNLENHVYIPDKIMKKLRSKHREKMMKPWDQDEDENLSNSSLDTNLPSIM